ncbi:hypothetical protein CTI12_AA441370 [Artemisia annua]|uniref:BED-type domain-containing protein n=1 Tax=Artemisia annua TaxID=35608 RepID=A0A2U1LH28_ARTAN|nr:hypothetical protein CTI12_AA441370 [Artemisia annua]
METQGNTSNASTRVESSAGQGEAVHENNIPPTTNSVVQDQNGVNDVVNEVEQVCGKRKLRSSAWNHFKKIKVNGEEKAECNYCQSKLVAKSSSGTRHLLDHFGRCLKRPFRDIRQHILMQEKKNADEYESTAPCTKHNEQEGVGPSLSASSGRRLGFKKLLSNIANIARQQDDSDVTTELENYYRENLLPTEMELDLLICPDNILCCLLVIYIETCPDESKKAYCRTVEYDYDDDEMIRAIVFED